VTPPELATALAALEPLLQRQGTALREGDADALAAASMLMRQPLAVLARHARTATLPAAWHARLEAMAAQAEAARTMLARRSLDVERSLAVLGASASRLQDRELRGVYGQPRAFASGALRSGAFERA